MNQDIVARSCALEGNIDAIEFPPEGKLRWRKIVRRSGSRPTGKYPSWKMGRMVQWESHNELNALRLLDADPSVTAFHEQPLRISYTLRGQTHFHIPDILVICARGKFIWEVKTKGHANQPDVAERTDLLSMLLPNYGYAYQVALAEDLACKPRLAAVRQVLNLGRHEVPATAREHIRSTLANTAALVTWGSVIDGVFGPKGKHHACRLMLEGVLNWCPDELLTRDTVIQHRHVSGQPLFIEGA
jgi:hypothetical protein